MSEWFYKEGIVGSSLGGGGGVFLLKVSFNK